MLRTDARTREKKRSRSRRLEARVSQEQKDLFLRAAELQGRSLTDFVIASAQQAAIEIVRTHDALRLSDRDRQILEELVMHVEAIMPPQAFD